MNPTLLGGILIGGLCSLWMLVFGYTGWYKEPVMMNMFWVVILIQIGVMIWGLKKTGVANSYGKQIGAGTLMSVYAGVTLFFVSLLFTGVLFPNYFEELRAMHTQLLRSAGKSDADIALELQTMAAMQTPFINAISGTLGTIFTGLIVSLILGAFLKKKVAREQQSSASQRSALLTIEPFPEKEGFVGL
ncbi:MAG: DUF4199 domain-containing protein [bacterium]